MKKHNKQIRTQKLSRKRLTQQEYQLYKQIGVVDESQDWLELFTPARVNDLFVIMRSCSDNQLKAKQIGKELKGIGFETIGEGTNILVMANPIYPGVCFKIALDDYGLADNFNDPVLEEMVNDRLKTPRYTHCLDRHPSGIVSVQERKVPILDQDRMDHFRDSILNTLAELAPDFLIVDLSPTDFFLNYGVERNGDWCFIDASDLYPLENLPTKIRCTRAIKYDEHSKKVIRCGGKLRYTGDFSRIYCPDCRGEFLPSEIRPKDKEDKMTNVLMDGMSREEREAMRQKQMLRVGGKLQEIAVNMPDPVPEKVDPEPHRSASPIVEETTDQILGRFKKPDPPKPVVDPSTEDAKPASIPDTGADIFEDDEPEEVTRSGIQEPAAEIVADLEPISENPVPIDPDEEPDEDDEDTEHLVTIFEGPDAGQGDPEPDEEEDDDEEVCITYTIVTDDEDLNCGITMTITGDPEKALEEYALPVFLSIDGVRARAISSEQMKNLLRPMIQAMLEEQG